MKRPMGWMCGLLLVVASWVTLSAADRRTPPELGRNPSENLLGKADSAYSKGNLEVARAELTSVVREFADSPSPADQDVVTGARLRLGYVEAKSGDFERAAAQFAEAEAEHKGTQIANPDFGGLQDQAAYQAAVCNAKDAPTEKAHALFLQFAKSYPNSPLIHAAFKRVRQTGASAKVEDEFQQLLAAQEAWAQREIALCGPRALAHAVALLGGDPPEIGVLEQWCGTDEGGTSMQGLREGAKRCGFAAVGMRVNRKDFSALTPGTMWLESGHYVVVETIEARRVKVFDPFGSASRWRELPVEEDAAFSADVLVLNKSEKRKS